MYSLSSNRIFLCSPFPLAQLARAAGPQPGERALAGLPVFAAQRRSTKLVRGCVRGGQGTEPTLPLFVARGSRGGRRCGRRRECGSGGSGRAAAALCRVRLWSQDDDRPRGPDRRANRRQAARGCARWREHAARFSSVAGTAALADSRRLSEAACEGERRRGEASCASISHLFSMSFTPPPLIIASKSSWRRRAARSRACARGGARRGTCHRARPRQ